MKNRLIFFVRRIGPYHDARFEALGRQRDLVVVETRPASVEYPWATKPAARHYRTVTLSSAAVPETGLRGTTLSREIDRVLQEHRPAAIACSGWADQEYHAALTWCQPRGIPAVVMSDSTFDDEVRRWWREIAKGSIVRGYAAAVAAGARSRDYLFRLGFHSRQVFQPLDVVDNSYFAAGADRVRAETGAGRTQVPRRFLCVARFIPKKNLARLIIAYAGYVTQAGNSAWELVLSGAGLLDHDLRSQVEQLGLAGRVKFAGFLQYPDLPAAYARAGALVLPSLSDQWGLVVNEAMAAGLPVIVSERCGCVPELVRPGENGWTFSPGDVHGLQACLRRMAELDLTRWLGMGRASREIIAAYSPESFARAVAAAVDHARSARAPVYSPFSRLLVQLVARRQPS